MDFCSQIIIFSETLKPQANSSTVHSQPKPPPVSAEEQNAIAALNKLEAPQLRHLVKLLAKAASLSLVQAIDLLQHNPYIPEPEKQPYDTERESTDRLRRKSHARIDQHSFDISVYF